MHGQPTISPLPADTGFNFQELYCLCQSAPASQVLNKTTSPLRKLMSCFLSTRLNIRNGKFGAPERSLYYNKPSYRVRRRVRPRARFFHAQFFTPSTVMKSPPYCRYNKRCRCRYGQCHSTECRRRSGIHQFIIKVNLFGPSVLPSLLTRLNII